MKTFKQHIKESRRLTPDQTRDALMRKLANNELSRDEMDAMINAPVAMGLSEELDKFLSEKGIPDGQVKNEMAEKLASIISSHRTSTQAEKLDFVNELRSGEVYDVKGMIDGALKDRVDIYSSKYMISTNRAVTTQFIKEFWIWEPQYDKRNVGGGETLMILCDPDGKKGGEGAGGDANLGPGYMIELKKSVSSKIMRRHTNQLLLLEIKVSLQALNVNSKMQ